jgi:hypothetical protein
MVLASLARQLTSTFCTHLAMHLIHVAGIAVRPAVANVCITVPDFIDGDDRFDGAFPDLVCLGRCRA